MDEAAISDPMNKYGFDLDAKKLRSNCREINEISPSQPTMAELSTLPISGFGTLQFHICLDCGL